MRFLLIFDANTKHRPLPPRIVVGMAGRTACLGHIALLCERSRD